jgi:hypothetical protein
LHPCMAGWSAYRRRSGLPGRCTRSRWPCTMRRRPGSAGELAASMQAEEEQRYWRGRGAVRRSGRRARSYIRT